MSDDATLIVIRDFIYAKVEHITDGSYDAWLHDKDLLNLYLQLKILDKLEEIRTGLIDVGVEVLKLNPEYK